MENTVDLAKYTKMKYDRLEIGSLQHIFKKMKRSRWIGPLGYNISRRRSGRHWIISWARDLSKVDVDHVFYALIWIFVFPNENFCSFMCTQLIYLFFSA